MPSRIYSKYLVLSTIFLIILSCQFTIPLDVSASEPRVGIDINNENGRLLEEVLVIPSNSERIYFEFNLSALDNVDTYLEFRWYRDSELIFSSTGKFGKGYTVVFLERDKSKATDFPRGDYKVEVWVADILLTSKSFQVE